MAYFSDKLSYDFETRKTDTLALILFVLYLDVFTKKIDILCS